MRATQFVAVSDASKKSDIRPIGGASALNHIGRLTPCSYVMIDSPENRRAGLLAQDVRDVFPHCVVCDANGVLGVNYIDILAYLISAIQALSSSGGICAEPPSDTTMPCEAPACEAPDTSPDPT